MVVGEVAFLHVLSFSLCGHAHNKLDISFHNNRRANLQRFRCVGASDYKLVHGSALSMDFDSPSGISKQGFPGGVKDVMK